MSSEVPRPRSHSSGEYGRVPLNPRVVTVEAGHILDSMATRTMLGIIRAHWPKGGFSFKKAQIVTKGEFWRTIRDEFRTYYTYPDGFDDCEGDGHVMEHVKNTMRTALWEEKDRARKKATQNGTSLYDEIPCYFPEVVWRSFCDHWLGNNFQKSSEIGCANRKKLKVVHTSGAHSFAKVKKDLARKYGEAPSQIALFKVTHKNKESNDYISTHAKDIAAGNVLVSDSSSNCGDNGSPVSG